MRVALLSKTGADFIRRQAGVRWGPGSPHEFVRWHHCPLCYLSRTNADLESPMKTKVLLATLALSLAPSLALAMGCSSHGKEQITMSCPEGQTLDVETNSCVTPTG